MAVTVVNLLMLIFVGTTLGKPFYDDLMQEQRDDTAVVESVVREARAVGPSHIGELLGPGVKDAFIHTYGDTDTDEGNLQSYTKKMADDGNDGYKHFDSFHKKDSDKYGYEVHSEYGKANKAEVDTADGKEKENVEEEDDAEESKKSYQIADESEGSKQKDKKAVEDYDFGYYADSGDSGNAEKYSEGESGGEGGAESGKFEESSSYESEGGEGEEADGYASEGDASSSYKATEKDDDESEAEEDEY